MAKKRSKAQKKKAQKKKKEQAELYTLETNIDLSQTLTSKLSSKKTKTSSKAKKSTGDLGRFFGYDVSLIYNDLFRTVLVTGFVLAVLVVIVVNT